MPAKTIEYKHPLRPFIGSYIKGHGEIDENDTLHIIVHCNMYAPLKAKKQFNGDLNYYRNHLLTHVFESSLLRDNLAPYLTRARMLRYGFCGMTWKQEYRASAIKDFERITENVGLVFSFDVESRGSVGQKYYGHHDDFIMMMLRAIDELLPTIQRESDDMLMFVPLVISHVRSERKITMLNMAATAPKVNG